ncbi:uncharacterized protein LOC107980955 [Nasonia vitripennis]|uniref:28S ribosomal protein S34, mitochondrial n=1 Tax=Nasonia vitripennis TaxID=7425 RepID=A0A7M7IQJ9_NASVI|nr:uncharacterized protein LOC107980955 [Nasonia vitripennis]
MPYKYIGKTVDFKGKTLWEILGNLKNFGVGRMIARNRFQRYDEPCYYKIMKVEALPNPDNVTYHGQQRKVIALVEKTFRGIKQEKLVQMESATYKADYFLVPKHKEAEFSNTVTVKERIFPREMEFPPLMKEFVIRQMKLEGIKNKEPKMPIKYNDSGLKTYRVAKEGETPTEPEPSIGLGTPASPSLYANIKE